jgi:hypothetical protein
LTTPTKANCNEGACHADPVAEGTESESVPNVEKQFDESTSKNHKYNAFLTCTEVKRYSTSVDSILEPAQISYEIYTLMKKFIQQSSLQRVPGHHELLTHTGLEAASGRISQLKN